MENNELVLVEYYEDFGRSGILNSVFVMPKLDYLYLTSKHAPMYVDELLGKHSEVEVSFNENDTTVVKSTDQSVIATVIDALCTHSNPHLKHYHIAGNFCLIDMFNQEEDEE